jgi:hypothetical protein
MDNNIVKRVGFHVKKTLEQFIDEARAVHGDKYDYSKVMYETNKTPVIIICTKENHGEFKQTPKNHTKMHQGCPKCYDDTKVKTTDQFIQKAKKIHGDKYDYSLVVYVNTDLNVKIICPVHGIFEQSPHSHLNGSDCIKCANNMRTLEQFIKEANERHNNKYDYSETIFIDMLTKVKIKCPKHGIFEMQPSNHIYASAYGCKKCNNTGFSKKQIQWLEFIAERDGIEIQHAMNGGEYQIGKYKVDGYCKETKTCYEFHGDYWHGNPALFRPSAINQTRKITFGELYIETIKKEVYLRKQGYKIVSIWESEWNKMNTKSNSNFMK